MSIRCTLRGRVGVPLGPKKVIVSIHIVQEFVSSSFGTSVFKNKLFIEMLTRLSSIISIRSGGTNRVRAFVVITAFVVSCPLQLQCSTTGSDSSFTKTMAVVIILAVVVSSAFISIIVSVTLFCSGFSITLTALSSLLVRFDPLSIVFKNIKKGTVSSAKPDTALNYRPGSSSSSVGLKVFMN